MTQNVLELSIDDLPYFIATFSVFQAMLVSAVGLHNERVVQAP